MAETNFRKLLTKRELNHIVRELLRSAAHGKNKNAIADAAGELIVGDLEALQLERSPITMEAEILGWVHGNQAETLAVVLQHLVNQELEKKRLGAEVLVKYKEVNLLYRLSERIANMLNRVSVCELLLQEAQKLVKITGGAILLFNDQAEKLEAIASYGEMFAVGQMVSASQGIEGSIFRSGRGEVINEVITDPRFTACTYPIHAQICVPLKTRSKVIGVASFGRRENLMYTAEDLQLINALASQGAYAIENASLYQEQLKDAVNRNEMDKGRKMQQDFLPLTLVQPQGWEVAARFKPAREVAGDFYDTFLLPSGGVGIVIADVCDKGVGSALFMALFRSLIRVFASQSALTELNFPLPGLLSELGKPVMLNLDHVNALRAVAMTNDYVAKIHFNLNMFATLFFGVLDPKTGILSYVNGGHEPLIVLADGKIKSRLNPSGPAVGMLPNMKFQIQQTYLEIGDMLFGYTDGVTEAKNAEGKFFTEKHLLTILDQSPSSEALLDRIEAALNEHIGEAVQFDDITMIALQRLV